MMTVPNYDSLIDAATWDFIRRTNDAYPPDTASRTIVEQRRIYDEMCRVFLQGYPKGVTARDQTIAGVPCRIYPGNQPSVVYLHGGGFVVGGLESHDDICAEIRSLTGLTVVAVDYRLSPENLHPAAFDDAMAVARAVLAENPCVLVGDSAGGNLAAAVSHALRGMPGRKPLGQVLIYAGLGGDTGAGSYLAHALAPMLTRDDVLFYAGVRFGGPGPKDDPTTAPLQDRDFAGLPPTVAFSAQCDPLADDGRTYVDRLTAAGNRAHWMEEAGLVHGYLRARTSVPRAAASFDRITSAIAALAAGDWPYGGKT